MLRLISIPVADIVSTTDLFLEKNALVGGVIDFIKVPGEEECHREGLQRMVGILERKHQLEQFYQHLGQRNN